MPSGLWSPFLLLIQAAWLLAPGLVVGVELVRRDLIARYLVVPVAGVVGAVLSYAAVWIYLANRTAGETYSYLTAALAVGSVAFLALRPAHRTVLRTVDVAVPLALLYVLTLFLVTATFGCTVHPVFSGLNEACHLTGLTGDNLLPQIFADNVLDRHPRLATWQWQGSARPPLQSGATLLQTPITGPGDLHIVGYQMLAVLLQVLWLPAVWAMLRILRLSGYRLAVVLTMSIFTGFYLYNSVFVWPKLLAASMVLTAFALLFFGRPARSMWALAGVAAGAGMVAHSGVAFTLAPIAVLLLLRRYRPSWGHLGLTAVGGLLMLGPWMAYQRLVDPPGDQLLNWHFAGQWQPAGAPGNRSFPDLLVDAYTKPSIGQIAYNKWYNFRALFGQPLHLHLAGPGPTGELRAKEMFYVVFGLGLFNLAVVLLLLPVVRRRLPQILDVSRLKLMGLVVGINLVIWPLLLYGPGNPGTSPAIFQGSYAMMALMFIILGAVLTTLPRLATNVLTGLNVVYATTIWVVFVWIRHHSHWSYLLPSMLSWVVLLGLLWLAAYWVDAADAEVAGDPDGATIGEATRESTAGRPPALPDRV